MAAGVGNYRGGYGNIPQGMMDIQQPEATASTSEKLLQAINLLSAIRADENIREEAVDDFLSMTIEGLIKIAEGESVAGVISSSQQPPIGNSEQYQAVSRIPGMYRSSGRVGG